MIFMCYTVLQCTLAGHNTLDAFFTVLVWSLMACKEGKWPHFMPNGDPVTGRWAQMSGYAWKVFIKQTRATIRIRIWDPPSFFYQDNVLPIIMICFFSYQVNDYR